MRLFALLLLFFFCARGMIQVYPGGAESILPVSALKPDISYTVMLSDSDSLFGTDQPYVSLNVELTRETTEKEGFMEVIIYESEDSSLVGTTLDNVTIVYCCSPELQKVNLCVKPQRSKTIHHDNEAIHAKEIRFKKNEVSVSINVRYEVKKTGIYILQMTNCAGNGVGSVVIKGLAIWRNAYGYLPGDVYMLLPVSGFLSCGYALITIYIGYLTLKYKREIMPVQYGIFAVLSFGTIVMLSWFSYRAGTNNTGMYSIGWLIFVVFLSNTLKMCARVLVLLVSMGLGIVKWTLGTTRIKLAFLSVFYLFFSFLLQIIKEVDALEKKEIVPEWVVFVVGVPTALLDTSFYYWIILSLIRTSQQLTLRRQTLKLDMYKTFFIVLTVVGLLALCMIGYQGYRQWRKQMNDSWKGEWVLDAFWDILFFGILTSVAIIWRPRKNNSRYGYGEFFSTDDEGKDVNDNDIPMDTFQGELSQRVKKASKQSVSPDKEKQVPLTDFEKGILAVDLPSEDGDDEVARSKLD